VPAIASGALMAETSKRRPRRPYGRVQRGRGASVLDDGALRFEQPISIVPDANNLVG